MPDDPHLAPLADFGGDWQLDAEPDAVPEPEPPPPPAAVPVGPRTGFGRPPAADTEAPPAVDRIVEALLFAGGPPLTATAAGAAVRGLSADDFAAAIDGIGRRYRVQRRPYAVRPEGGGFVLVARGEFAGVREKLTGGPREVRLGQPALDVLSLVAYRQPVAKGQVDALRGSDAGPALRQLVRLGLVALARDSAGGGAGYTTTPRFLELFGLSSLDDLPRVADAST